MQRLGLLFSQRKKGHMKRTVFLLFTCFLYFSCKKDSAPSFQNEGVITGINTKECPCIVGCPCFCGGLYFHFTDSVDTANMLLDNPAIFNFGSNTKFPVYVKIYWQNITRCDTTVVKITAYEIL
jgi:hypothetical protein